MADYPIELEADSGLPLAVIPAAVCRMFGIEEQRRLEVTLPDGSKVERGVGQCEMTVEGRRGTCSVFLGERLDRPVMGWVTLQELGLMLDPFTRMVKVMVIGR